MWIKKITQSLYLSIFVRMVISAFLSLGLFLLLLSLSNLYEDHQSEAFNKKQEQEINELVSNIKAVVLEEKLTFDEAEEIDFDQDTPFEISWYHRESNEYYDEFDISNQQHIFLIPLEGSEAFMIVNSETIETTFAIFQIFSAILSIFFFFVLSIYLTFKQLAYIKTISKGIDSMTNNNLNFKVPIKGKNELAELATNINNMADSLNEKIQKEKKSELSQRMLITNISHDLKTPLTMMIGYIDIIKRELNSDDELYQYANIANENGARLDKLITDLFLYSKLISGDVPVNLSTIDINIMLRQILEIRSENVTLDSQEVSLFSNIDPKGFQRAMDNLINNAHKYGVVNKPIEITSKSENGQVVVSIKNLTEENLESKLDLLQTRLYTAHEDRSNGSSGLGLSIVTELLKTMEGTLHLDYKNKVFTASIKLPKV